MAYDPRVLLLQTCHLGILTISCFEDALNGETFNVLRKNIGEHLIKISDLVSLHF